ncbi:virulence factor TspB C-terminal domain-related protein [Acinetobacter baumannii]|uniref:Uncharacterized protein n=2 Tax=Acinetobacter baumannii TaxID=470 RepID=A0AB73FEW6_ACIBA|nr:virulence factor TspB C-terminal domain-related protein [Acinetobacter baumannii]KQD19446.1 hypothetical protein APD06_14980 [Acinetobacter baumannii]
MGADLFSINGRLFRCVTVAVTQLILIMSFLIPYSAYANTASTLQTSYLGRLSNGYHQFKYTITNTATGLNKSVTKAISPASLGKVLRFVVSKRLAVFASFATVASDLGYSYDDQDLPLYNPGVSSNPLRSVPQPNSNPVYASSLSQICAAGFIQLQYSWSQFPITSYENCRWGNPSTMSNIYMDLCYISASTGDRGCVSRDLSIGLAPSSDYAAPKRVPITLPVDHVIPQAPAEDRSKIADPAYIPTSELPSEVKDAINELNADLSVEDQYKPIYIPSNPSLPGAGSTTGSYGDGAFDFELPSFCSWAEPICKLSDWFMNDDIPENEQRTLSEFDFSNAPKSQELNLSNTCPANPSFNLDFGVVSSSIEIPTDYFCSFLIEIRPFLIASSYLFAAWIIYSFRRS